MNDNQRWIDAHVHLFTGKDDASGLPRLGCARQQVNTPKVYCDALAKAGCRPSGVIVVHFSKAPDSSHVIHTLDEAHAAGCRFPIAGVIHANVEDKRTFTWIQRPDVKAVRIYAKDAAPDFSNILAWNRLFNLLRAGKKHILIYGGAPYLRPAIAQLPKDIPLVIDHLGMPDPEKGINDHAFATLLADMKSRNRSGAPVYYKGPGYRTSFSLDKTQPFVNAIVAVLGTGRLILGASDAPFAGPALEKDVRYHNKPLTELVDFSWMHRYVSQLAQGVEGGKHADALLYANAARLYGF